MDRESFSIDSDGTITLRGFYHIYKNLYDTPQKAKDFIDHLCRKAWFKSAIKEKTIKAMGY